MPVKTETKKVVKATAKRFTVSKGAEEVLNTGSRTKALAEVTALQVKKEPTIKLHDSETTDTLVWKMQRYEKNYRLSKEAPKAETASA